MNRYALLNGDTCFLVADNQFFELNRPLLDLRYRFPVDDRDANILRLEFAHIWQGDNDEEFKNPPLMGEESAPIIVERENTEAAWRVVEPVSSPANLERVEALVSEVQYGVGRNFIDNPENLADYGLQPAEFRITVFDEKTGDAQTLYLGDIDETDNGIFVRRIGHDAVFMLDAHLRTLLPRNMNWFREHRLITQQTIEPNRIDYQGPEGSFVLEDQPEDGWRLADTPDLPTDQSAVSLFISTLKRVEGAVFMEGTPAQFGLDTPEVLVTLHSTEGAPREIKLARADEESWYATQDLGDVMRLPAEAVEGLMVGPEYFHSRQLMYFEQARVNQIDFTFEGEAYLFEKVHDRWLVRLPENHRLGNQSDVDFLLDAIGDLRAVSVQPERSEEPLDYGLEEPALQVTVTLAPPNPGEESEVHGPLTVGNVVADIPAQRYAQIKGRLGVYRVKQDVVDGVRESLRGLMAVQPSSGESAEE